MAAFAEGFLALADFYNVELIGGDMTRGPLSMTVSIKGVVPEQFALRPRNGAQPGDAIFVTGTLGDGALALQHCLGKLQVASDELPGLMQKLEQPQPRILAGMALRNLASSCLDISDGLSSDLQHILVASGVGAQIELSPVAVVARTGGIAGNSGLAIGVSGEMTTSSVSRCRKLPYVVLCCWPYKLHQLP